MNKDKFESLGHEQKTLLLNQIHTLLSEISHELKSPLGTSLTASSNLINRSLDIQARFETDSLTKNDLSAFLELVYESSKITEENIKRSSSLIEHFGTLTRLQGDNEKRNFNLYTHINNIVKSLSPRLTKAHVEVSITGDRELHINLYPAYLLHVLDNLILNSLKHGFSEMEGGKIDIEFALENSILSIDYKDNGSGIPDSLRKDIFETGHRTSEKTGGTGLGMSIVHSLITDEMGGTITLSPVNRRGACFTISIPV